MKLHYSKKRLNSNKWIGLSYLAIGIAAIIYDSSNTFNYFWSAMAIIYICIYLFESQKGYATIENGTLTLNKLIPEKLELNGAKHYLKFKTDYIIKTPTKTITLYKTMLDDDSIVKLEEALIGSN